MSNKIDDKENDNEPIDWSQFTIAKTTLGEALDSIGYKTANDNMGLTCSRSKQ